VPLLKAKSVGNLCMQKSFLNLEGDSPTVSIPNIPHCVREYACELLEPIDSKLYDHALGRRGGTPWEKTAREGGMLCGSGLPHLWAGLAMTMPAAPGTSTCRARGLSIGRKPRGICACAQAPLQGIAV